MLPSSSVKAVKRHVVATKAFSAVGRSARLAPRRGIRTDIHTKTATLETVTTQQSDDGKEEARHLPDRPYAQPDTKHDGILMQVRVCQRSLLAGLLHCHTIVCIASENYAQPVRYTFCALTPGWFPGAGLWVGKPQAPSLVRMRRPPHSRDAGAHRACCSASVLHCSSFHAQRSHTMLHSAAVVCWAYAPNCCMGSCPQEHSSIQLV